MLLPNLDIIKRERERLGLSQKELAKMVDVSTSMINQVESGSCKPSYATAKTIFEKLTNFEESQSETAGDCSVTGGFVYRGGRIPALYGRYIYGDYCTGRIWALQYAEDIPPSNELLLDTPHHISSFGIDENDELYICSFDGNIYRFNYPPTAEDDYALTPMNTPVLIDVLANDSDYENDLFTISIVSNPGNGTAVIEDNNILYTPNDEFSGMDTFFYTVIDEAGGESQAQVNVYVEEGPQPSLFYTPNSFFQ